MCVSCIQANQIENDVTLSVCTDCGYKGNTAYWIGTAELLSGETVHAEGHVYLDESGDTFDVSPLLDEYSAVESFDGSASCPICDSDNLY